MTGLELVGTLKAGRRQQIQLEKEEAERQKTQNAANELEQKRKEIAEQLGPELAPITEFYMGLAADGCYHYFDILEHDLIYLAFQKYRERKLNKPQEWVAMWFTSYIDDDYRERFYTKHNSLADALIEAEQKKNNAGIHKKKEK